MPASTAEVGLSVGVGTTSGGSRTSVYSAKRDVQYPKFQPPKELKANSRLKMDGHKLLKLISSSSVPVMFFDPQYRGVLDKMSYGNEGENRSKARCMLPQMSEDLIEAFIVEASRILVPTGHLFLWMDKFHFCSGFLDWTKNTELSVVDLITWNKGKIGMGYRTRRKCEYLAVFQKQPRRAKGVWKLHNIPDVWDEKIVTRSHAHDKPVMLQQRLIQAVSNPGDFVIDPAAGSFSVLRACQESGRNFLGGDING